MTFAGIHVECGGRIDLVETPHSATSLRCLRCSADGVGDLAPPRVVREARTIEDAVSFLAALGFVADGHTRMEPVGGWRSGVMGGMARKIVGGRARYVLPVGPRLRATVGARTVYLYTRVGDGRGTQEIAHLRTRGLDAAELGRLVDRHGRYEERELRPIRYSARPPTALYPAWTVVQAIPGRTDRVDCKAMGLTEKQARAVADALEALPDD